ncbi:MAG: DUF3396 domain-containing protein [Polyangiaceae bacterium]|nr:DUF3396 domain-containing protein [Polyangiaceae bacterium]
MMPLSRATLVRAGERPELGDQNALEYPQALREVAQRLDPFFVKELPEFPGRFTVEERTSAWFHRFDFPEKWG